MVIILFHQEKALLSICPPVCIFVESISENQVHIATLQKEYFLGRQFWLLNLSFLLCFSFIFVWVFSLVFSVCSVAVLKRKDLLPSFFL